MSYKILSLDGGGVRGILTATLLELVEREIHSATGQTLHDFFDLIVGTSSGSILASGITFGKTGSEMVELFLQQGKTIFPYWGNLGYVFPQRLPLVLKYGLSAPKFSNAGIIKVLQQQFGNVTLKESLEKYQKKLMITAYDTVSRRPIVFKNWSHHKWYASLPVWELCVCSAAAPTYFPAYLLKDGDTEYSMIDGGVAANNPTICAIAAALHNGYNLSDLHILSIGSGETIKPYSYQQAKGWGLLQWAARIIDVLLDAPININEYVSSQIMMFADHPTNHYIRLQPYLCQKYLQKLLDVPLQWQLKAQLQGKKLLVKEEIDNASPFNLQILMTLAQAYYLNGILTFQEENYPDLPVQKAVKQFITHCD